MNLFAAGNDLVTLILALIPVAVFVLSNLYKAFAKANPLPEKAAPPPQPQGGKANKPPRTMDLGSLEAFLREAKKQGANKQSNRSNSGAQTNQATRPGQTNPASAPPVFAERVTSPPNLPSKVSQKQRNASQVGTATTPTKSQKKITQSQQPSATEYVVQNSLLNSVPEFGLNLAPIRARNPIDQNPVGIALAMLRKPNGGAGAFVLQEILGAPRCRRPHRPA